MKIEFYNVKRGLIGFSVLILILIWLRYDQYQNEQTTSWVFKGDVKNVKYGFLRSTPVIKVNGKEYDLQRTDWDSHLKIQIGDTIVKHKGSHKIFLIRHSSNDTLNYY
jgi:hypothetical protein